MNLAELTNRYDDSFDKARSQGLTWLPWVGSNFPQRPPGKRLLIVGESHYAKACEMESKQSDPELTRKVVWDCLDKEWTSKMFKNIPRVLFGNSAYDLRRFWSDTAYYNFVQRLVLNDGPGKIERPINDDFMKGWKVFPEVVRIIKPSHCLFIGVAASKFFNRALTGQQLLVGKLTPTQEVSNTWGQKAKLNVAGSTIELIFVQHLGSLLSWRKWHECLKTQHPELMDWLKAESYATA